MKKRMNKNLYNIIRDFFKVMFKTHWNSWLNLRKKKVMGILILHKSWIKR